MSATAVSGWGAAVGAAALACSKSEPSAAAGSSRVSAQSLIPVVGLVNRTEDRLQVRSLRWQRMQKSSRTADVRHQWRAQSGKYKAASVNESQFEAEVLKSSVPVLVDFWASWCGPCRLMGLTLDWAAQQYDGKIKCVKIETDFNEGLVDKYKVYGLPTVILFVNGEVVPNTKKEGALTKEKLQAYLEQNLPALAATT